MVNKPKLTGASYKYRNCEIVILSKDNGYYFSVTVAGTDKVYISRNLYRTLKEAQRKGTYLVDSFNLAKDQILH
jgi:hypothetical protein